MNILVLGSSFITSAIIKSLLYIKDVNIIVVDRKDPHYSLNMNLLSGIKALSTAVPDLKKSFDYTKGFKLEPNTPLSFLFRNPLSDSMELYQELSKVPIDIVIDSGMMSDPYYCNGNPLDCTRINTEYPTRILSVLNKLPSTPQLYINLSNGIVYGKQKTFPIKEDVIPNPIGVRAGSLLARENIVSSLCKEYDIPFITLRLGTPIGYYTPYENVVNQFAKQQLLDQPITISGDGSQARDFFDLNDLAILIHRIVSNVIGTNLPEVPFNKQGTKEEEEKKKKERLTGIDYIDKIKNQIYNIGGYKTDVEAPLNLITLDRQMVVACSKIEIPENQGKVVVKNSRMKKIPWRNSQVEDDVQIWMDIKKAMNVLEYDPEYNLLSTIKTEVIPYIASNFLSYDDEMMKDLKKMLRV